MYVLVIKRIQTSRKQFHFWVLGIENWIITDVFVLLICFKNFMSQVPDPEWIVII